MVKCLFSEFHSVAKRQKQALIKKGWVHTLFAFSVKRRAERNRSKMYRYRKTITICECCGFVPPVHTHHIVPVSAGGTEDKSNYEALCIDCHIEKHPELPRGFVNLSNFNNKVVRHGKIRR